MKKGWPILIVVALLGASCTSSRIATRCGKKCETGTLYYLPDCKEIKGYVNFDKSGIQKVFQHDLPVEFQKDSIKVCINYEKIAVGILMSDCLQSEIIKIKCISKL